jgi:hypothetical protein
MGGRAIFKRILQHDVSIGSLRRWTRRYSSQRDEFYHQFKLVKRDYDLD